MAVVIKVSTEDLYAKVGSISDKIKGIRQEIANINKLQTDLAQKYWAGDAAAYHFKEVVDASQELGPQLYSMADKTKKLFDIAVVYDKVEGYNKHAEAALLPTDFLE